MNNKRLLTLTLNCSHLRGKEDRPFHAWVLPVLETILTKHLRRLEIAFSHPKGFEESELEALDWKALDNVLARIAGIQKNIEVIQFSAWVCETRNGWREQITKNVLSRLPEVISTKIQIQISCFCYAEQGTMPSFPETN